MKMNFIRITLLTLMLWLPVAPLQPFVYAEIENKFSLTAEQWAMPRHGESLLQFTQLKQLYQAWAATPGAVIEIHYPGGEAGELWMEELQDWLVSLGIPSEQIQSLPGSGAKDIINLTISTRGELTK